MPITDTTTQMWHRIHDYPRVLYKILQCPFSPTQWIPLPVPLLLGPRPYTLISSTTSVFYRSMNVTHAVWSTSCGWTNQYSYIEPYQLLVGLAVSMEHAKRGHQFLGALIYGLVYDWQLRDWTWLLCNCLIGLVAWCFFCVCCWLFVTVWFQENGVLAHFYTRPEHKFSTHFSSENMWWPHILAYEANRPDLSGLVPLETP